ncbi:MAG: RNA 2',3'-cyclic phosphodiesterase [Bifidobacteriaceae bacterium]|jgi:2'-5' RNA ligase|nr:RNA 2',3'-cyclic phosphodiesterase [Bifidobacteriaceae bacterium]
MRLFAAIRPPAEVTDHLAGALAGALGPSWDRSAPISPRLNWHITLAFYGDVPDAAVPDHQRPLALGLAALGPFTLELRGAGVIRRQVGWIGVGGQTAILKRAMKAAAEAGQALPAQRPEAPRALRPHLTITRSADKPHIRAALQALAIYQGPSWLVTEVELIASELGRGPGRHALHRPVAAAPLG